MTTAIDTNVIVSLWDPDPSLSSAARSALESALENGPLIVSAPVFAELIAFQGRDEAFLESFFEQTGMSVEWNLDKSVWRAAGLAFRTYSAGRRRHGVPGPRRILADFVIGAHAARAGYRLLTFDDRFHRAAFPDLTVVGF
ncbi:MAG TPA: PIN domain-containing protein [Terriglobia bacterium]|nr:PIN domain-containing protein [Terriglobia bacterium]